MRHRLAILTLCLIGVFASESAWANRYYSPEVGRFISRDPLGVVASPNQYGYTEGNTSNWVDPLGTFRFGVYPDHCTVAMIYTIKVKKWPDSATKADKSRFKRLVAKTIEDAWNKGTFRIFPAKENGNPIVER